MINRKTVEFSQQQEYANKLPIDYMIATKNPIHRYSGQLEALFFEEQNDKEKRHLQIVRNSKKVVTIKKLNSRQKRKLTKDIKC